MDFAILLTLNDLNPKSKQNSSKIAQNCKIRIFMWIPPIMEFILGNF
jgi:hypothetical protein